MKKFSVLILDDESSTQSSSGYRRVVDLLENKIEIINRDSFLQVSGESYRLEGNAPLDITVWGGATDIPYDYIIRHLKRHPEEVAAFDIFFIDLKWDKKLENEDSKVLIEEEWQNFSKYSKKEDILQRVPTELAGLELLHLITDIYKKEPKVGELEKPKILFSGAKETAAIRYLLKRFLHNRLEERDLLIANIDQGEYDDIKKHINHYFKSIQEKVIAGLPLDILNKIEGIIDQNEIDLSLLEEAFIPDIHKEHENWSIKTLFPIQWVVMQKLVPKINRLDEQQKNKFSQAKNEILNIAKDYKVLLRDVLSNHREKCDEGECKKQLQLIKEKEFVKIEKYKNSLSFIPVGDFIDEHDPQKSIKLLSVKIVDHPWDFKQITKLSEESDSKLRDFLYTALVQEGFYPGYLEYIYHITRKNSTDKNNQVDELTLHKNDRFYTFIFSCSGPGPVLKEDFRRFFHKINGIKKLNFLFKDYYAEGVEDIAKIICYRYKGHYDFVGGNYCVNCFFNYETGKISAQYQEKEHPSLVHNKIQFLLKIPRTFNTN